MSGFAGFGAGAADFFAALAANNNRSWFTTNRARFEGDVKAPFAALLDEGADRFGGAAKIMRQNRDTRFSKDKTPYKTAIYGMIRDDGRLMARWAMLDADDFFAGGGVYGMTPAQLARYREAVSGGAGAALDAAIAETSLTLEGEGTKGAPRGYPNDHPRLDLLRRKALILGARIPAAEAVADAGRARDHAMDLWARVGPVMAWLDAEVGV